MSYRRVLLQELPAPTYARPHLFPSVPDLHMPNALSATDGGQCEARVSLEVICAFTTAVIHSHFHCSPIRDPLQIRIDVKFETHKCIEREVHA